VRRGVAIVIDVVLLVAFAAVGRSAHDEGSAVSTTLAVAWPFVAAWLVFAWQPNIVAPRAGLTWIAAWPLALILRHLSGRGDAPAFAIVLLVIPLLALTGWRGAARLVSR
jgi:hypothetical protein